MIGSGLEQALASALPFIMPGASLVQLDLVLRVISVLGSILVALKLYRTGLHTRYPVLFWFFLFRIPNSIWPFFLPTSSKLYFYFWIYTGPVALLFYVLMAAELYKAVFARYKGLSTVGRWGMYASVAISVTISALTFIPEFTPSTASHSKYVYYNLAFERGVDTALALFVILLLCFVSFLPLRLSRNVRVHALVFSIFFLSNTFVLLMQMLFNATFKGPFNTAVSCVTTASVIAWLTLLSKSGEEARQPVAATSPEHESRLLAHLDALNSALLRSSRPVPASTR